MLRITTEKSPGRLASLSRANSRVRGFRLWSKAGRTCAPARPDESLSVNLCGVSFIDAAGKALLKEIHQQGGKLVAEGCLNQAIVREIATGTKRRRQMKTSQAFASARPSFFMFCFWAIRWQRGFR